MTNKSRTNLALNPGFEGDISALNASAGWYQATTATDTTPANVRSGSQSLKFTSTAASGYSYAQINTEYLVTPAGKTSQTTLWVKRNNTGVKENFQLYCNAYNASTSASIGAYTSPSLASGGFDGTEGWQRMVMGINNINTFDIEFVLYWLSFGTAGSLPVFSLDEKMHELVTPVEMAQNDVLDRPFFSGATPSDLKNARAWLGTPNASASVEVQAYYAKGDGSAPIGSPGTGKLILPNPNGVAPTRVYPMRTALSLPEPAGGLNGASTPDAGDMLIQSGATVSEVRWRFVPDPVDPAGWANTALATIMSKWSTTWYLGRVNNAFAFYWVNMAGQVPVIYSGAIPSNAGHDWWYRLVMDNVARTIAFGYSTDGGNTWINLGGATSMGGSYYDKYVGGALYIGTSAVGNGDAPGLVRQIKALNTIGGVTNTVDIDFTRLKPGTPATFTEPFNGRVWTMIGSASIVDASI